MGDMLSLSLGLVLISGRISCLKFSTAFWETEAIKFDLKITYLIFKHGELVLWDLAMVQYPVETQFLASVWGRYQLIIVRNLYSY